MGLASTVNFVLIGLAVLLLDVRLRRSSWPAQVCALATFTITFLNFLVYFYPVEMSVRLVPYLSIAMHTVVAFLMLAAAILLARPDRGFMAVFIADNTGGLVAQRMLPAALLLPALVGWLCTIGQHAGYYGHGVEAALLATSLTLIFTSLVWWSARELESTAGQRRKAEKDLLRSERELSDFFDNAVVAMHWIGPDGRVLRVNKAELAMLGYTQEEYVGRLDRRFSRRPGGHRQYSRTARSRGKPSGVSGAATLQGWFATRRAHRFERVLGGRQIHPRALFHSRCHRLQPCGSRTQSAGRDRGFFCGRDR